MEAVSARAFFVLIAVGFILGVIFTAMLVGYYKDRHK
jgi:hypothetical protein